MRVVIEASAGRDFRLGREKLNLIDGRQLYRESSLNGIR